MKMGDGKDLGTIGPWSVEGVEVAEVGEVNAKGWDALIVVLSPGVALPQAIEDFVVALRETDAGIDQNSAVVQCPRVCGSRLVLTPTGPLTPYDDVRSVGEAARAGVKRALCAGARRPVLVLQPHPRWPRAPFVALLGALEAAYVPLQSRESFPALCTRPTALGVYAEGVNIPIPSLITEAVALETARYIARDVGGADPERMPPLAAAKYLEDRFRGTSVSIRVLRDKETIRKEYPLFAAVTRAADSVPRHAGCIVFLEYVPEKYEKTLMLVGKGVTYDTGGCDVKVGGAMMGMSRDKCGAANVAGFLMACDLLRPSVKVVAALGFARNSIGEEAYVSDELVMARCGQVVRVGNTDAEGRMVMADLLCEMHERSRTERDPHLYTVATLTGHAERAYGEGYTAAVDNHTADLKQHADLLRCTGQNIGDMIEVSRIRREDLSVHQASYNAQLLQATPRPSSAMARGHQAPAAFLLQAAQLHKADAPAYTHLDIAASAGEYPLPPTGAPILALAAVHGLLSI
ncbi:unnamed protein product [Diatraea saccharalis]|uniref:Cytosol aminopeptidase domain-containing protein n=1 Tax=Diatraea saccharalis TaxID=40085 RepID=A0A9N9RCI7_9NEOP|nr:unnamed protein product [Diatraea saccharalis]